MYACTCGTATVCPCEYWLAPMRLGSTVPNWRLCPAVTRDISSSEVLACKTTISYFAV